MLPVSLVLFQAGCSGGSADRGMTEGKDTKAVVPSAAQDDEAEVRANLAKLSPEDRKLAEAQKFCVVEEENRLGSMGMPVKVLVKDQPVFLCCKGCTKKALADPDKTLAMVKRLKEKNPAGAP
jgi:hypothetical protein